MKQSIQTFQQIPRQTFIDTLIFIDTMDAKFETMRTAMEDLSPGDYVNFMPESQYTDRIVKLITSTFPDPFQVEFFEFYYYDCDRGTDLSRLPDCFSLAEDEEFDRVKAYGLLYDYLNGPLFDEIQDK